MARHTNIIDMYTVIFVDPCTKVHAHAKRLLSPSNKDQVDNIIIIMLATSASMHHRTRGLQQTTWQMRDTVVQDPISPRTLLCVHMSGACHCYADLVVDASSASYPPSPLSASSSQALEPALEQVSLVTLTVIRRLR